MANKKKKSKKSKKKAKALDLSSLSIPFDEPLSTKFALIDDLPFSDARTITVVAENVEWMDEDGKPKNRKMESGRMAAQVGHAVSKLKLSYVLENTKEDEAVVVNRLINCPITSIVLKARDSNELRHVLDLCQEQGIHAVAFYDDGNVYDSGVEVLTAISIGPVYPEMVINITGYLPLWRDSGDGIQ